MKSSTASLLVLGLVPAAGALLLLGQKGSKAASNWPEEARMRHPELFNEPPSSDPDEQLWSRFILDPKSGAPDLTTVDLNPKTGPRPLTAYERWALAPYFPVAQDLDRIIYLDTAPPSLGGRQAPPGMLGATEADGRIYFPNAARSFLSQWWLAVLAHELHHAAQIRIGATIHDTMTALQHWGYLDSPMEVQSRHHQLVVLRGLKQRARQFYGQA